MCEKEREIGRRKKGDKCREGKARGTGQTKKQKEGKRERRRKKTVDFNCIFLDFLSKL
mgnify:CR=1 FL=1